MIFLKPMAPVSRSAGADDALSRQGRKPLELHLHQVLQARVVRPIPGGFELETANRHFQARSGLSLKPGQLLALQVARLGDQVELRLLDAPRGTAVELPVLLRPWPPHGELATAHLAARDARQLQQWLSHPDSVPPGTGGEYLRTWAQLVDRLLRRQHRLPEEAPHDGSTGSDLLAGETAGSSHSSAAHGERHDQEGLLAALEYCRQHLARKGQQFVPLLLPFLQQGYLRAPGDGEADGRREGALLSIHLELENLGPLRVDVHPAADGLNLKFVCGAPATTHFLEYHADLLRQGSLGSLFRKLEFINGEGRPAADLLRAVVPQGESLLQVKA